MADEPRKLNQRLDKLSAARLALTIGLAVFVPLVVVFAATGESPRAAVGEAAFWTAFAVIAALGGRALGRRRHGGGPGPPR
jgi:hypothetical protein